jgi:hypothetical protein
MSYNFSKFTDPQSQCVEEALFKSTANNKKADAKGSKVKKIYRAEWLKGIRDAGYVKKDGTASSSLKMFPSTGANARSDRSIVAHARNLIKKHKKHGTELKLPEIQNPHTYDRPTKAAAPSKEELFKARAEKLRKEYGL